MKTLTGVKYIEFTDGAVQAVIYMKTNDPNKPYHDVRVRQALQLAIDSQKIRDQYFGGEGIYPYWPVYPCKEYAGAYKSLTDYPASVQELFGHNVTKAKQLLADAGYADGFKATIMTYNLYIYEQVIEMVKDMWKDIGVDLTIQTVDYLTWYNAQSAKTWGTDMLYGSFSGDGSYFKGINWSGTTMFNSSFVDDQTLNDYRDQMMATYLFNEAQCDSIHQQMLPYLLQQCYVLQTAAHYTYCLWWPWLKNYSGEGVVGYYATGGNWMQYVWIDQALKKSMGH